MHEQIAECRMQRVRGGRRDHHFGIAGDFDFPARPGPIGDPHPAQLDIVLWRDDDFGVGLDLAFAIACTTDRIQRVATAELGPPLGEDRLIPARLPECRLMGDRPEGPARHIADIAEGAPIVAGAVLVPARDGELIPATVAPSGIGDHHVVAAVGQQLHLGYRRIRVAEHPDRRRRQTLGHVHVGKPGGM